MKSESKLTVDIWANWWNSEFFEKSPEFLLLYERLKLYDRMKISIELIENEANLGSVNKILLSATAFKDSPVTNKAVYEKIKNKHYLFYGCASVNPLDGFSAVKELRRAINDYNFIALKILPFLYGHPPNHAIYFPLYSLCIEFNIPVLVLTGHTAILMPNKTGHPSYLDEIALHFPELKIIAGHAGYPWTTELISLAWKHKNVFIETSGHRPRHFSSELIRYLNSYGKKKVLFGTGYPIMNYCEPISEIKNLKLSNEAEENYLGKNAVKIWPQLLS